MKQLLARCKPFLRWLIFGATLFFIGATLHQNWNEVKALRITGSGWSYLGVSLGVTLIAHIWTGWVWSWILRELGQPAEGVWGVLVYLKTNIAKYLPGNVWHLYGRIMATKQAGFPIEAATLSVLLEPLLMAAAALLIALTNANQNWLLQVLCLGGVLLAIHPKVLNPLLKLAGKLKDTAKKQTAKPNSAQLDSAQPVAAPAQVRRYPLLPLLGEVGFVGLRGVGFLLTLQTLQPITLAQVPPTLSAFSIAWVLGLVIPGAPGGIGVFEATTIALLNHAFPASTVLGSVALYRLISILAEAAGAGLAIGFEKLPRHRT